MEVLKAVFYLSSTPRQIRRRWYTVLRSGLLKTCARWIGGSIQKWQRIFVPDHDFISPPNQCTGTGCCPQLLYKKNPTLSREQNGWINQAASHWQMYLSIISCSGSSMEQSYGHCGGSKSVRFFKKNLLDVIGNLCNCREVHSHWCRVLTLRSWRQSRVETVWVMGNTPVSEPAARSICGLWQATQRDPRIGCLLDGYLRQEESGSQFVFLVIGG